MKKYLGIDLGGTNIALGIVDETGHILARDSVPTGADRPAEAIIAAMADAAESLMRAAGIPASEIESVGVGSPGGIDREHGIVLAACNLPFAHTPLAELLHGHLGLPVYVDNDANCAAWAEAAAGAAAGTRHSVTITLGTGIGGGIVIDGKLYGGFNNLGGEFGHAVIEADGELCPCGRRGCLEAYASATALARDAKRAADRNPASLLWNHREGDRFTAKSVFDAASDGDADAAAVLNRFVHYLALGLVGVIKIFQPEVIVIGGGVAAAGDALMVPLREAVMREAYRPHIPESRRTKLAIAKLGGDAGIIGAALLGMGE